MKDKNKTKLLKIASYLVTYIPLSCNRKDYPQSVSNRVLTKIHKQQDQLREIAIIIRDVVDDENRDTHIEDAIDKVSNDQRGIEI